MDGLMDLIIHQEIIKVRRKIPVIKRLFLCNGIAWGENSNGEVRHVFSYNSIEAALTFLTSVARYLRARVTVLCLFLYVGCIEAFCQ